jgi:ornithine--oxo-acid transaminase
MKPFFRSFTTIANNYNPLPVNIVRGKDIYLYDINNKKYTDLLAGYSAVNQGHCHPKLVSVMKTQCSKLTLTSRVVMAENLFKWANYITNLFQYDKALAMNSGAEAVETAMKLARRYGYQQITKNPKIICLNGNFHGRTLGTISLSDYFNYRYGFGPLLENIVNVPFNDCKKLIEAVEKNDDICAILYEPIQGEGGINAISTEYFNTLHQIKKQYPHILLIADEIQTGLGRCGGLTAGEVLYPNIKPDVLILGKALSGGMLPMSCILADKHWMDVFNPGSHGSTYGGNPLACSVSIEALKIIKDECIPNVIRNQELIKKLLLEIKNPNVISTKGVGMFCGIQFEPSYNLENLRLRMLEKKYITCTSRNNTLRITPPLTISKSKLQNAFDILNKTI